MNKPHILVLFCIALIFFACKNSNNEAPSGEFTIRGSLKGIDSGTVKLMTYNEDDRTSKTIDSGTIHDHAFVLKGTIGVPQMVTIQLEPGNWTFQVFAEDTVLNITADTAGSQHYDYTAYGSTKGAIIKNFTETGSANFDAWKKYQDDPGQKQYEAVFARLDSEMSATKDIDVEYAYRDQMDSVSKLLKNWQKGKIDEYVDQNPSSIAGAYMFHQWYIFSQDVPIAEMEGMLNKYQGQAKESVYYKRLVSELAKKKAVAPGSVAPDFVLLRRDSSKFDLSSTRGKYMMIDFWASWCHPCRKAIPHWKQAYQKYHSKGFDIVSVSDDSRWKDWMKAMDQEKMPWQQVCDEFPVKNMPARVGSLYMTTYIPFYVLLDKEGKILVYSGNEQDIDNKLKEIFGS